MATLLPETLNKIFNFAAPESTFESFSERSTNLRNFSLVCGGWRQEAQRLLWREPLIYVGKAQKQITDLESLNSVLIRHLRVVGDYDGPSRLVLPLGTQLATGLGALYLFHVSLDPVILVNLPSLRMLSLSFVRFVPSDATSYDRRLEHLTDLSMELIHNAPPSNLFPQQLPALQRLAINASRPLENKMFLQGIIDILPQLDFFSFEGCHSYYLGPELFAAGQILLDTRGWHEFATGDFDTSLIKHISWRHTRRVDLETVKHFVRVHFPSLETLVVPAEWSEFEWYSEANTLLERNGILLVLEDKYSSTLGESLISSALEEHRWRRVAK